MFINDVPKSNVINAQNEILKNFYNITVGHDPVQGKKEKEYSKCLNEQIILL